MLEKLNLRVCESKRISYHQNIFIMKYETQIKRKFNLRNMPRSREKVQIIRCRRKKEENQIHLQIAF